MPEEYGAFQPTISVAALVQSGDFSFSRSWQALPARIIIHLPHEKRPRFGGAAPTPPGAALGKHSANVHFARLHGKPLTPMPPAGRNDEIDMVGNKKAVIADCQNKYHILQYLESSHGGLEPPTIPLVRGALYPTELMRYRIRAYCIKFILDVK